MGCSPWTLLHLQFQPLLHLHGPLLGTPNPSCQGCASGGTWPNNSCVSCLVLPLCPFGPKENMLKKKKKKRAERPQGWAVHSQLGGVIFLCLLKKTFNKSLRSHDLHVCFLFVFPHQLNSCFPSTWGKKKEKKKQATPTPPPRPPSPPQPCPCSPWSRCQNMQPASLSE